MGNGPCGPNTEVYYDFSPEMGNVTKIDELDSKRFLELGNIVFPEFYLQEKSYSQLPLKCVDVGVGLERVAMVLQKKSNSFEIDI
jgi:alanyl-tRNA synthetase